MKTRKLGVIIMDSAPEPINEVSLLTPSKLRCYGGPDVIKKAIDISAGENIEMLVGPEWSLMEGDGAEAYSQEKMESILEDLRDYSRGIRTLIFPGTIVYHKDGCLYNLLPVINNGKIIKRYHKRFDGGTTDFSIPLSSPSTRTPFGSGNESGVFRFGKERIGVEICADAGTLEKAGVTNLDFQILLACGRWSSYSALKYGGVFICSDGERTGGICHNERRFKGELIGGGNLQIPNTEKKKRLGSYELKKIPDHDARLDVYLIGDQLWK